jgi:phosphatidylserine synthase
MKRRGEKIGWIGGWFGAFAWLGLLSAIWLFQNKISEGMIGLVVFIIAIITISMTVPWKYPNTKYWKLMLPIYSLFFCSIVLSIYLYGGLESIGLKWTSIFLVIPGLIPLVTAGNRTWNSNAKQDNSPNKEN